MTQTLFIIAAIVLGHLFAHIDHRPHFDDAGILAFAIAITCAIFAFISPRRPWLWALLIGIWIPLHDILHDNNYGSLIALAFAFAGAYLGAAGRWLQGRSAKVD